MSWEHRQRSDTQGPGCVDMLGAMREEYIQNHQAGLALLPELWRHFMKIYVLNPTQPWNCAELRQLRP